MKTLSIIQRVRSRLNRILREARALIGSFFYRLFFLDHPVQEKLQMSPLDAAIAFAVNNQVEGDYLEFGVYKGRSFIRAYKKFQDHIERHREYPLPRFIAFDSFEGLPESREKDKPAQYQKGAYSTSERRFVANVVSQGVDPSHLVLVPGFYDKSLNEDTKQKHDIQQASVIYIDCDVYESAVSVFHFITNIVQTGTVIVVDDWFRHRGKAHRGIQRACNEWLVDNSHIKLVKLHVWERVAFIVICEDEERRIQ